MAPRAGFTFGTKNPLWPRKVEPYLDALRHVGLEPVLLMPGGENFHALDAFVIGGGTDIDPARYDEPRHAETEDPDTPRDHLEAEVLHDALTRNLPVLAICRGLQMFQIAHGGKLAQHIDDHRHPDVHDAHTVYVEASTRLHAITGATEFHVNSRHHQAAIDPPGSLTISARAEDGTIEALERPDLHFALAVQWHPEDRVRTSEPDRRLFEAFSEACRR